MRTVTAISPRGVFAKSTYQGDRRYPHTRILRWTFRRDEDEAVVCELALTGHDREYELRAPAQWNPTGRSVERFDDAADAYRRWLREAPAPAKGLLLDTDLRGTFIFDPLAPSDIPQAKRALQAVEEFLQFNG